MKKRGHGEGYWNGVGGKLMPSETTEQAVVREAEEEVGVTPHKLTHMADICFLFPARENMENQCAVFLCDEWGGDPTESEEMAPKWFNVSDIPYDKMWESDVRWLPKVLAGERLSATVIIGENDEMVEYREEI
jgi:mutator protein MutT